MDPLNPTIMTSTRKITLKSSENETFEIDESVALESQTIKYAIGGNCDDVEIDLARFTSKILAKVIEYCKKHAEAVNSEENLTKDELESWDAEFVKVDQDTLFDLILTLADIIGKIATHLPSHLPHHFTNILINRKIPFPPPTPTTKQKKKTSSLGIKHEL